MRQFLLIQTIIATFMFAQTDGEVVKNVVASQRTDGSKIVDIYYDLEATDQFTEYRVYVKGEWPDADHEFFLNSCRGDVWNLVFPGEGKHIECKLGQFIETEWISGNFYINVYAESNAVSELPESFIFGEPISLYEQYSPGYDFELMQTEVTTMQYVEFLNSLISNASSVNNFDTDWWPDQEGGEIYDRLYTQEDGSYMGIKYDVNEGIGYVYGDGIVLPGLTQPEWFPFNDGIEGNLVWLILKETSDDDMVPSIQFSGGVTGSDDVSFFITPGMGNHPVTHVSYYGAESFANYYGLRIPFAFELASGLAGSWGINYNGHNIGYPEFFS